MPALLIPVLFLLCVIGFTFQDKYMGSIFLQIGLFTRLLCGDQNIDRLFSCPHHGQMHLFIISQNNHPFLFYHIVAISTIWFFCFSFYNDLRRKVVTVMFDYSPLWETMQRRGVSQYQLLKSGVDNKTLDALKKGRNITMVTLEKLCRIIGCTPNDVIRFSGEPR